MFTQLCFLFAEFGCKDLPVSVRFIHVLQVRVVPFGCMPKKNDVDPDSLSLCFCSAIEGQFGGIWDRGSLVAINPCDRQKYVFGFVSALKISAFKTFVGCFRR